VRRVVHIDMPEVDLSDLANGYEYRPLSATARTRARNAAANLSGLLVDVGGGTGGHADIWSGPGRVALVIDPSETMCRKAAARGTVAVVRAVAQSMPIETGAASLVYFHLSLHYGSFRGAIDEAFRIARSGGSIEIWTFAPEKMRSSALAQWFPRIGEIDAERFPAIEDIVERFSSHGAETAMSRQPEVVTRSASSWVAAVKNRFVSTIQFLDADEIEAGLQEFAAAFPDPEEPYTYTIEFVRIRATLRPLR